MTTEIVHRASNGVVRTETHYSRMPLAARVQYAEKLAMASDLIPRGLFDKATGRPSAPKIFLVFETGAMLGLDPMASLQGIDVIEGKAAISPQLMTGIIRAAGHKLKIEDSGTIRGGDYTATVTLTRADDPENPISADWSLEDAAQAELISLAYNATEQSYKVIAVAAKSGEALPWQKYTKDMCLWRALGRLGRRGANDILMGISYIPEELVAAVGEDGTRATFDNSEEDALIEELKGYDDKAEMAAFYQKVTAAQQWTPRLTAEFDAHLSTITKDSRPPRDGAPGHTGDKAIDAPTESATAPTEPGRPDVETESTGNSPEPTPDAAQGHTAPPTEDVVDAEVVEETGVETRETTQEEYDRIQAAEFDAAVERGEIEPGPPAGTLFDASALQKPSRGE